MKKLSSKPRIWWSAPGRIEHQGDCACATNTHSRESQPGEAPPLNAEDGRSWRIAPALHQQALDPEHTLFFNTTTAARVAVLNRPARDLLLAFTAPLSLAEAARQFDLAHAELAQTTAQLAALGLLRPVDAPFIPSMAEPNTLTAWLHVTNACNLRCDYCYLALNGEKMDEATGLAAVAAVFRTALVRGFRRVKLKYAGGEPALNFDLVLRLHEHASQQAAAHHLELAEVFLSNGLALTNRKLAALRDAGIRLMLSVDSLEAASGGRAFENHQSANPFIEQALLRTLDAGLKPHLSITLSDARVLAGLPALVAFALAHDLSFHFNLVRDADPARYTPQRIAALVAALRDALAVLEDALPQAELFWSLLDLTSLAQPHQHACGATHQYLAVNHRGETSQCHMLLDQPAGSIHAPDLLAALQAQPAALRVPAVDARPECAACVWRYQCAGGCPLHTMRLSGRFDQQSPYCAVYKAILPELLRLEGLRLLKWQTRLH